MMMDTNLSEETQKVYEIAYEMLMEKLLPEYEAAHDESVRDQAKNTLSGVLNNTWCELYTLQEWEQRVRANLAC